MLNTFRKLSLKEVRTPKAEDGVETRKAVVGIMLFEDGGKRHSEESRRPSYARKAKSRHPPQSLEKKHNHVDTLI